MSKREFTVENEYPYNLAGPLRWIVSHTMRYPWAPLGVVLLGTTSSALGSQAPLYLGRAFDLVLSPERSASALLTLSLTVLGLRLGEAVVNVGRNFFNEILAQRMERDARDELYISLLGVEAVWLVRAAGRWNRDEGGA